MKSGQHFYSYLGNGNSFDLPETHILSRLRTNLHYCVSSIQSSSEKVLRCVVLFPRVVLLEDMCSARMKIWCGGSWKTFHFLVNDLIPHASQWPIRSRCLDYIFCLQPSILMTKGSRAEKGWSIQVLRAAKVLCPVQCFWSANVVQWVDRLM